MTSHLRPDRAGSIRLRDFALHMLGSHGAPAPAEEDQVRAALAEMVTRHAGTELVREGQALDAPMLLLEGWAIRQRILPDGQRQIFSFVLPGDPIGLCDRADGHAIAATVALTDVTVAAMPVLAEALWRRIGPLHLWGRDRLSLEERGLYDQVVRLGRQSAYQRLVHLILDFYYRLNHAGLVHDRSFTLPFTQEVLSDALGLSTVHTNRTLQQLRRDQLIETHGQHVRLLDIARLAQIGDYHPPRRLKLVAA